jgi:PGF-pre-PGF domain-containing protein
MAEANVKLDEIMANPSFRKALHIIGTVAFGFVLLRLTLFILDTTHLGTAWLETHQDTGFLIIILVLVSLLLLMDHTISYVRRYYGEEKNSIIDVGLTVSRSNIEKYESKSPETFKPLIQKILTSSSTKEKKPPEIVKPRSRESDIIASELSGLSQKYQKEEPASPEVPAEPVRATPAKIPAPAKIPSPIETPAPVEKPAVVAARVMKKEPPIVRKEDDVREFLKDLMERPISRPEMVRKDGSKKQPIPASTLAESHKSSSLEDMILSGEPLVKPIFKPGVTVKKDETPTSKAVETIGTEKPEEIIEEPEPKPEVKVEVPPEPEPGISEMPDLLKEIIQKAKPEIYDDSNVIFSDTVPILVMQGKRVLKAFEAEHSITVIDFKSKVTQKNVKLTIESLNAPSREAKSVNEGLVYEYNNIHINLDDENIEKAVVRFKVRRDWIIKNNISTMQLQQYIHDEWAIIPTKKISQDAKFLFYEVYVPSFSLPFAIVGM